MNQDFNGSFAPFSVNAPHFGTPNLIFKTTFATRAHNVVAFVIILSREARPRRMRSFRRVVGLRRDWSAHGKRPNWTGHASQVPFHSV